MRASLHFWLVLAIGGFFTDLSISEVQAQLFGERNLGGGLRRNEAPTPQGPAPQGSGMELRSLDPERFVRGQRRADAFVGGQTDPVGDFVGRDIPATGVALRSAIDGTLPRRPARRASQINRPLPPSPRNALAPPRLAMEPLPLALPAESSEDADSFRRLDQHLTGVLVRLVSPSAYVHLDRRRAVIEGSVSSDHQRRLAEIMVRFEPGVDEVTNRLEVVLP